MVEDHAFGRQSVEHRHLHIDISTARHGLGAEFIGEHEEKVHGEQSTPGLQLLGAYRSS